MGVVIGAYMTWMMPVYYGPFIAALAAFFVCAAGNVINDIKDVDIDRVNHPDRVLVRGTISVRTATRLAIFLNILALICAIAVNREVAVVVVAAIGLLVWYNLRLKRAVLVGNLAVAMLSALTFMTGGWAVDSSLAVTLPGPLIPAVFAFFFHLVREILKDAQDVEGDSLAGYSSLPIRIGISRSLSIALGLFVLLLVLTLVPIWKGWFGRMYEIITIYIVGLPLMALLIFIWGNPSPRMLRIGSTALKIGMVLGLVALVST